MFEKLQKKWKVTGLQVLVILCTFAIGGSLTGYVGKKLMNLTGLEKGLLWVIVYIILITIIWPVAVLVVSIPFGQFTFFKKYIAKLGRRIGVGSNESGVGNGEWGVNSSILPTHDSRLTTHVAIFASGTGTNAQKLIDHFRNNAAVKISLIVCNKPGAGVLQIAAKENIPSIIIEKEKFFRGNAYIEELKSFDINFIILAGFLWKIPSALIKVYPSKIVNIHPALLPAYGGKGMYGAKVHEAVIAAGEKESGITIHYVDEIYDHGKIIFQAKCDVLATDTPDSLAQKIHSLEHQHFPLVMEQLLIK